MIWELWEFSRIMPKLVVADTTIWLEVSQRWDFLQKRNVRVLAGTDFSSGHLKLKMRVSYLTEDVK